MKYYNLIACIAALTVMPISAQDFSIPVLENDEPMATGKFEPRCRNGSVMPSSAFGHTGGLNA